MEFSRELENSPELFSQDDTDVSLIEVKVEPSRATRQDETTEECQPTKTSLIEAMQKLDNENGEANVPDKSSNRISLSTAPSNNNMTPEKKHRDPTIELKKKISKKITDYFGKKP